MPQAIKNVIPFRQPQSTMEQDPLLRSVYEYWNQLRDTRIAPHRADFDPVRIHQSLKHTFILSAKDHQNIRFRIVGHALIASFGLSLHGMPATSLIVPDDRERYTGLLSRMIYDPRVIEIALAPPQLKSTNTAANLLLLPLQARADGHHQILGVLHAPDIPKGSVNRLAIQSVSQKPIHGTSITPPAYQIAAETRAAYTAPTPLHKKSLKT